MVQKVRSYDLSGIRDFCNVIRGPCGPRQTLIVALSTFIIT